MAQTLEQWLNSKEVLELQKKSMSELLTKEFFRDPSRRLYYNPSKMYSPADGTILYVHQEINPTDKIVEVKGKKFTVQDLLHDKTYVEKSLVIGIFMSVFDVHINRMPTRGFLSDISETPFLVTHNTSMYFFEQDLLEKLRINLDKLNYLFRNEKWVSTIRSQEIKGEYYIVQIADKDINCIVNWGEGDIFSQGERFGMVRWGSQVDLIIPLKENSKINYEILVKPSLHVKAGIDPLIKIK